MLEVRELQASYGAVAALKGISLRVGEGEIVSLIGANGAGKSTTLRVFSGLMEASGGSLTFDGRDIAREDSRGRVEAGMVLVPEGRRLFPAMTVEENLYMGAYARPSGESHSATLGWCYELFPVL